MIIVSSTIVSIFSKLLGFSEKQPIKAVTVVFIIFIKDLTHPKTNEFINHEKIHIRQNIESLGLYYLISKIEYFYARIFLKYSHREAYKYELTEQECYLNQSNHSYLKKRPLFNTLKYLKKKTSFSIDNNSNVIINN